MKNYLLLPLKNMVTRACFADRRPPSWLAKLSYPFTLMGQWYRSFWIDIWVAEGIEKKSREPLSIAYAAGTTSKNFLLNNVFEEGVISRSAGRFFLCNLERNIIRTLDNVAAIFLQLPDRNLRFLRMQDYFCIPCWVKGEIDLTALDLVLRNSSIKSDIRRIRKHRLTYSVTIDTDVLSDFYSNMYVPQIRFSHSDTAFIESYKNVKEKFAKSELLLVHKEDTTIGGIIIVYGRERPGLWLMGVRDAKKEYRNMGVVGALFYFALQYLSEKGYTKVGLGGSRPFLNDGVLQYKRKWHQKIVATFGGSFIVKQIRRSKSADSFFVNNPFICRTDEFEAAVFVDQNATLTSDDVAEIRERFFLPGLARIVVYALGREGNERFFDQLTVLSPK